MAKNQRWALITVGLMALLALPTYVIIGILTLPVGLGLFMLMSSSPWILNLYPFVFASKGGDWRAPVYYLDSAISLPLTVVQWTLIAWLSSFVLRNFKSGAAMVLCAMALLTLIGVLTSTILSGVGVALVWKAAHM